SGTEEIRRACPTAPVAGPRTTTDAMANATSPARSRAAVDTSLGRAPAGAHTDEQARTAEKGTDDDADDGEGLGRVGRVLGVLDGRRLPRVEAGDRRGQLAVARRGGREL